MDIKIEIKLKDSTWGFSDLLGGRELNSQTKKEIIELLKEDIGEVFDQQIKVEQLFIPVVSVRKIVRCEDPMVCLRGCSVHKQTCKHPIYER